MGSFRSQPDLAKHTLVKSSNGLTYAVTHMCGTPFPTQAGASTWKMLTSPRCPSPIIKTASSQSSTATAVPLPSPRR